MTGVDQALVRNLQQRVGVLLQDEQRHRRTTGLDPLAGADERQAGRSFIQTAIAEHRSDQVEAAERPLSVDDETALAAAVEARVFGAGRLQHLLDDPSIENIDINGHDAVHVTYADGTRTQAPPVAESDAELIGQIQLLAAHAGLTSRPFDAANPELDLRLPDGSRLSAIQGNTRRPAVSIRRHRFLKVTLPDLVGTGTMTDDLAAFLAHAVRARLNVMIAGATNAGKTTLLRAMASEIDSVQRVITIERALEIGLDHDTDAHPNAVALEESLPNSEGYGGVSMEQLLRRTLRMNPDRVIVGEVLGPEIVTMLNAMNQGNEGSLSTIHARSARGTFDRIATYARQSREALDRDGAAQLVAGGLDLVVFVRADDTRDTGRRSIREVLAIDGFDGTQVTASALYTDDGTGTATRNTAVAITPRLADALAEVGWTDEPAGAFA